ncbi:hypothetical protein ACFLT2_12850 [Acidobacteriota bacterium]
MAAKLISLALGFLLGLVHFYSEKFKPEQGPKHYRIFSFAAGISIAYLFLDLLPHTYEAATHLKNSVFIFLLLGFALIHLFHKYIFQHTEEEKPVLTKLHTLHSVFFFLYYFMVGLVLCEKVHASYLEAVLFMIPVTLHAGLSTASLSEIHGEYREVFWIKLTLSLSPLLGVLFSFLFPPPQVITNILVSFIAGTLLYIFVKEFLPEERKGQPVFFVIGITIFFIFYVLINVFNLNF